MGRDDVLACLDRWLDHDDDTRWVFVTGGPGMGKSAILATWLARREAAHADAPYPWIRFLPRWWAWLTRRKTSLSRVPHHFISRLVAEWSHPDAIARSLVAQIEAAFPALRGTATDARPALRLETLLCQVSNQLGSGQRLVVVIDGLDETSATPGENPLPHFLPHALPARVRFLCATRVTYPHLTWIEQQNAVRRLDIDSATWAASNQATVRGFWEAVAREYQPPLSADTVAAAIARADGNLLYAVMLHSYLSNLPAEQRRADRIPMGLKTLIGDLWNRAALNQPVASGLTVLCAAQEALSLSAIGDVVGHAGFPRWTHAEEQRFVQQARQLLLEEPASWADVEAYRLRHDWVREVIAERLTQEDEATVPTYHVLLSRVLATWPPPAGASQRRYALRHALTHRAEAGDWADAWRIAADLGFLEAKCRELSTHEAEADVTRLAERCRASGDAVLAPRIDDLAQALMRESHWLRAAPEATAALVRNRLRLSGWSAAELDDRLRLPDRAAFLRVRHAATRESPALLRDFVGHHDAVMACAVTPDGRRVVSASRDRTLKVWDFDTGRPLLALAGHTQRVAACAVTADSRRVVSASWDETLKVWDLDAGRLLATLQGHTDVVTACVVTPDGRRVVSASHDQTLKVWSLGTRRPLATLRDHIHRVTACAVTSDGRRVVSASEDETLKVWDLDTGRLLATLHGHTRGVQACAVTPDGRRVVSASEDETLKVWDLDTGRPLATLQGHTNGVTACAMTPDGHRVVSASEDRTLKVWDLDTRCPLGNLQGHADEVTACPVTPDGRRVVSASSDGTLKVWDLDTGRPLATIRFKGYTHRVTACVVTPDGRRVVLASDDKTLKVLNLDTGQRLATLGGHTHGVTACAVTPDGRRVVSASEDRTLRVWDLDTGRPFATLQGHTNWVTACAVTPDGRRVVSASDDQTLKTWDIDTGQRLATFEGHALWVTACAVTPDGGRVVSASVDRTLRVWDLDTGRPLATLQGHTDEVTACAVTPDGRRVVSASEDRTLKVWDLDTYVCVLTHRGSSPYKTVAATTAVLVAGDAAGGVWFLDWPA